ncbi:Serine/threonine-protein kinase PknD [compost metagenome]
MPPAGTPASESGMEGMSFEQISGQVDFGSRSVQATIKDDVAPGATVSLIEIQTGKTLTSTLTDSDGRFVLTYSNGFKPVSGALYYFEAVKGLAGPNGDPNAIGADAVRVRTIATYRSGGWKTLSSSTTTTSISITPMTTALSIVVSLRTGTAKAIDATSLFGAIKAGRPQGAYPDTLSLPNPALVPTSLVQSAYDLVIDSLAKERDPVRWIAMDSHHLNTVSIPAIPFSIKFLSPSTQEVGQWLEVIGVNFAENPANNRVYFTSDGGWVPATEVMPPNSGLTRMRVKVPAGAINGPVRLEIGGQMMSTDPDKSFRLAVIDGHSVVRTLPDGKEHLFVANPGTGTLSRVTPSGEVFTFYSGLDRPQALTFGPDGSLYVACGGAKNRIVRLALTPDFKVGTVEDYSTSLPNPTGLAFDVTKASDRLGVTNAPLYVVTASNQLYLLPWSGSLTNVAPTEIVLSGAALSSPRGLSFGYKGESWRLWIANSDANNVVSLDPQTGAATIEVSGIGKPSAVAFDSQGNLYVSSNTGNSIFRRDAGSSTLTSFANVPSPAGLDADASGYIYCADNVSNRIYTINSQGESRLLSSGISYPLGVHVDADGIFVVTELGQILRIAHGTGDVSIFADGLSHAMTLGRDQAGKFYVFQPSLGRITRVATITEASGRISGRLDSYLSVNNVRDIFVSGSKLYLQKTATPDLEGNLIAMGGVEIRDLATWGTVERSYAGFVRDAIGMSFDRSAGAYRDSLYIANFMENSIVRMEKEGATPPTGKMSRFVSVAQNSKLVRPNDVWVDPANGNVWVSLHGTDANTDGLLVFNAAGTEIADYSGRANRPRKFGYDGTHLYLVNQGAGKVVRIDRATGAELTSYNVPGPLSVAFDVANNRMYVGSDNGNIYTITGYRNAPSAPSVFHAGLLAYDLHVHTDGLLYVANSNTWRIKQDGSTRYVHQRHYGQLYDFAERADGTVYHLTRDGRFDRWDRSYRTAAGTLFTAGSSVVPDGRGNWVSVFETICGGKSLMVGDLAGTFQQYAADAIPMSICWVPEGSMTSDGNGRVFVVSNPRGQLHRFDVATRTLELLQKPGASDADRGFGVALYNDTAYVTLRNKHVIDLYGASSAAGTAYLGTLGKGLLNPEL